MIYFKHKCTDITFLSPLNRIKEPVRLPIIHSPLENQDFEGRFHVLPNSNTPWLGFRACRIPRIYVKHNNPEL